MDMLCLAETPETNQEKTKLKCARGQSLTEKKRARMSCFQSYVKQEQTQQKSVCWYGQERWIAKP